MAFAPKGHLRGNDRPVGRSDRFCESAEFETGRRAATILPEMVLATFWVGFPLVRLVAGNLLDEVRREDSSLEIIVAASDLNILLPVKAIPGNETERRAVFVLGKMFTWLKVVELMSDVLAY